MIEMISIGGSPLSYGNVITGSNKYGNMQLEYLTEYIRKHSDENVHLNYFQEYDSVDYIFSNLKPNNVYCIAVDIVNYYLCVELANKLKTNYNSIIIVCGRIVSTNYNDMILRNNDFDYYLIGDGEQPLSELLEYIKKNQQVEFNHISIATKNNYKDKKTDVCDDIDRWPAFDFYDFDEYEINKEKIHCLSTKNNVCSGNCSFCWSEKGDFIYKSVDRIVKEIFIVATKYGIKNFYFTDNNLFDSDNTQTNERLFELFSKIRDLNLKVCFSCFAKANSIKRENDSLYKLMHEIGFYSIFIGVDTGNKKDLCLYRKQSSLMKNIESINLLRQYGFMIRFGFINFNPFSSFETLKDNYFYLKKIKSFSFYSFCSRAMLFPETDLWKSVKKEGLFDNNYMFCNIYSYKFLNNEIQDIFSCVNNILVAISSEIDIPFSQIKKKYHIVKALKIIDVQKYEVLINNIEKIEREIVLEYFYHLFVKNDVEYCKKNLNIFIDSLKRNARYNKKLLDEFSNMYNNIDVRNNRQ